jgi:hypothetical protein
MSGKDFVAEDYAAIRRVWADYRGERAGGVGQHDDCVVTLPQESTRPLRTPFKTSAPRLAAPHPSAGVG